MRDDEANDVHTQIILARYADRENIRFIYTPPDLLVSRYLSKVMMPTEISGKTVVEVGAGCSQYGPVFLRYGCKRYFANDIIPERINVVQVSDPRFAALPGDFRKVEIPEPVDIVFASLTMMFIIPMLDSFVDKIMKSLKPGGAFLSMDTNYLCPLSVLRLIIERKNNPSRLFNPFRYADSFRRQGFAIDKLVPFTAPVPAVTGNWLLGTNFWLRARKL